MTCPHNVRPEACFDIANTVSDPPFEISYAAHTATCTFLLDAEGICRRIVVSSGKKPDLPSKSRASRLAARCVGTQYVASLDPTISGMLTEKPRVGSAMLFARVDERGRVSLVRTGIVTQFECHRTEDPFQGTAKTPSASVETSAPAIPPSSPAPRFPRPMVPPPDPYEEEASARTQPIQSLRPREFLRLHAPARHGMDDDASLHRTSERNSERVARRATWPSPGTDLSPPPVLAPRQPSAIVLPNGREERGPSAPLHGPLPRPSMPSAPGQPRTRSDRIPRSTEAGRTPRPPPKDPSIDRVASRRRGDR